MSTVPAAHIATPPEAPSSANLTGAALTAVLLLGSLAACASAGSHGTPTVSHAHARQENFNAAVRHTDRCLVPSEELLVRQTSPTLPPAAIALGLYPVGCPTWQNTLQQMTSTAPRTTGYCTQFALASQNPGYDINRQPAPQPRGVFSQIGPAC
jgi:hypothetical protein